MPLMTAGVANASRHRPDLDMPARVVISEICQCATICLGLPNGATSFVCFIAFPCLGSLGFRIHLDPVCRHIKYAVGR